MRKQQTNGEGEEGAGGGRLLGEASLVASHRYTVIRECLSNYDSVQCRPCWWTHTWGTRYMLFIPQTDGRTVA